MMTDLTYIKRPGPQGPLSQRQPQRDQRVGATVANDEKVNRLGGTSWEHLLSVAVFPLWR
jgi:hypothetical protein